MEIAEEKPKKRIWIYGVIVLLIVAVVAVYFIFFASAGSTETGLAKVISFVFGGTTKDFSLVPTDLKKDVTGGIINLKFDPNSVLEHPVFKSLHSYAEPVELENLGRPNPFISY